MKSSVATWNKIPEGMSKVNVEFTLAFKEGELPNDLFRRLDESGITYEVLQREERENEDVYRVKADLDKFIVVSNAGVQLMGSFVVSKDMLSDVSQMLIEHDLNFVVNPINGTPLVLIGLPLNVDPDLLVKIRSAGKAGV
jgi:hypothetical protein